MSFTFTQQIENTQNEIAQLQAKLDTYSKTDDYLNQSLELHHQVTDAGFTEEDLQIVRDRLQEFWNIVPRKAANEHSYDSTSELEQANSLIVELQGRIKSLEVSLETAITQRDRIKKKYTELLEKSITNTREEEFLDLVTQDELEESVEESVDITLEERPLELRVKDYIKKFKGDTATWEQVQRSAIGDSKFFQQIYLSKSKKKDRIHQVLPQILADYISRTGDYSDKDWIGISLWQQAENLVIKEDCIPS